MVAGVNCEGGEERAGWLEKGKQNGRSELAAPDSILSGAGVRGRQPARGSGAALELERRRGEGAGAHGP